jgi:hypothetical protein
MPCTNSPKTGGDTGFVSRWEEQDIVTAESNKNTGVILI